MRKQGINLIEFGNALGREEMRKLMAGSWCPDDDPGCGGGGGQGCNCLYCELSNGGLETYAADCATNPPNYPSLYCVWFTGDPFATGSYGIC